MYYVPSIEKEIPFKELTIQQLKTLINKQPVDGFNLSFINILKENNIESPPLTNFDKEILLAQIHLIEIKELPIINKIIPHPTPQTINDSLYNITINVPSLEHEQEYCELINSLDKANKDDLLLAEIGKYILDLSVNKTSINCKIPLVKKIQILKKLPPNILAKCIPCIDNVKHQIKLYYTQNNITYKYELSLLVP